MALRIFCFAVVLSILSVTTGCRSHSNYQKCCPTAGPAPCPPPCPTPCPTPPGVVPPPPVIR